MTAGGDSDVIEAILARQNAARRRSATARRDEQAILAAWNRHTPMQGLEGSGAKGRREVGILADSALHEIAWSRPGSDLAPPPGMLAKDSDDGASDGGDGGDGGAPAGSVTDPNQGDDKTAGEVVTEGGQFMQDPDQDDSSATLIIGDDSDMMEVVVHAGDDGGGDGGGGDEGVPTTTETPPSPPILPRPLDKPLPPELVPCIARDPGSHYDGGMFGREAISIVFLISGDAFQYTPYVANDDAELGAGSHIVQTKCPPDGKLWYCCTDGDPGKAAAKSYCWWYDKDCIAHPGTPPTGCS